MVPKSSVGTLTCQAVCLAEWKLELPRPCSQTRAWEQGKNVPKPMCIKKPAPPRAGFFIRSRKSYPDTQAGAAFPVWGIRRSTHLERQRCPQPAEDSDPCRVAFLP